MKHPRIEVTTYIASASDKVWSALTDPSITQRYWGGSTRILGGQLKTGNLWTGQNRQFPAAETSEFYFVPSSVRKSVCTLVRQLRGPHFSTCA